MSRHMGLGRMARRDDGQALVEFALVLPIILLLLFGMLQVALVLNARQTVAYAAQAAANGYAQTLQRTEGDARARTAAAQLRPDFARAGRVEYSLIRGTDETRISADGVGGLGDLLVARVTYEYPSPVRARVAGFGFPDTIRLTAEAVARIEKPDASSQLTGVTSVAPPPGRRTCYSIWIFLEQHTDGLDVSRVRRSIDGSETHVQYAAPGTTHSYLVTAPTAISSVSGSFTLPSDLRGQWYGRQRFLEFPNGRARLTERAASWSGSQCPR